MSDIKKGGGPAFPVLEYIKGVDGNIHPEPTIQSGMSLRDWFAGMALNLGGEFFAGYGNGCSSAEHMSGAAFQIADAMLAEREKVKCTCGEPHISDRIVHRYDGKPCYVKA